jgi:hypothetical protein
MVRQARCWCCAHGHKEPRWCSLVKGKLEDRTILLSESLWHRDPKSMVLHLWGQKRKLSVLQHVGWMDVKLSTKLGCLQRPCALPLGKSLNTEGIICPGSWAWRISWLFPEQWQWRVHPQCPHQSYREERTLWVQNVLEELLWSPDRKNKVQGD